MDSLVEYVAVANLDAIAITNHDIFDHAQYEEICEALDIVVFPGIEINLETGHLLLITSQDDAQDFAICAKEVENRIQTVGDKITTYELQRIFGDLSKYLLIPHYDKKPAIKGDELERIKDFVSAGEVDSPKKFVRNIKDEKSYTPMLFSDVRIREGMSHFPVRQSFIDCGDVSIGSIKSCLQDKTKVSLSEKDGNKLFQILTNGQKISTGLNVLLGGRSAGKTHTLNQISGCTKRVKYIEQFSLVQQDEAAYKREFSSGIKRKRSQFVEDYLLKFRNVLNEIATIDLHSNEEQVSEYLSSLLKSADETARKDSFSNAALFDESPFSTKSDEVLGDLIRSVRHVIENLEYRPVIERHVDVEALRNLACELIETLWKKESERNKKNLVNSIVKDVREKLRTKTSATQIKNIDFYQIKLDERKVEKFEEITSLVQADAEISREEIQGFSVVASKSPYSGPGEVKNESGLKVAFKDAYDQYKRPYEYLCALEDIEELTPSEFYKYFVKIDYKILNKDGYEVSGGERSEFRLLQEIQDSHNFDILLIDEPESSFDNAFLNAEVNQMIKQISSSMPVIVVTHNSTVGGSIGADYLIYASKEIDGGGVITYRLYSGYPGDDKLVSIDGKKIKTHDVVLTSLEAGSSAYEERSQMYENIKN